MIETKRIQLINGSKEILRAAMVSDKVLAAEMNVKIADNWNAFGAEIFEFVLERLRLDEKQNGWWTYFPILKSENILIGSCGFKGLETDGYVEIGYEVAPAFRNQGLATEMAKGLIAYAFSFDNIKMVIAHTLPKQSASTSVLTKCGMKKMGQLVDPDEGPIWQWRIERNLTFSHQDL